MIQQSPENLLIRPGQQEARLECFHGDNSFPYMLWYRHRSAAGGQPRDMDLIGLLHYENADVEKTFATERFNITDVCQSVLITQWPHYISRLPNGSAEMHCYQNETNYDYVYWYRQQRGQGFQLMAYVVGGFANYEEGFTSGYQAVKVKEKQLWSLSISSVQEEDEAVYLCAASLHSAATDLRPAQKLTATREAA
ncbi:hypothetical protein F7725_008509 [Dissostichus mawsoni]|uniref:Ig-like domain-containing protein n=1 Tax=Dissostichus mawsoni TaxID=36200 RepID=A0A7J5Y7E5_DISMA|nr:hypothetical protein F7725_008509 [Dissostichus mawsoni]